MLQTVCANAEPVIGRLIAMTCTMEFVTGARQCFASGVQTIALKILLRHRGRKRTKWSERRWRKSNQHYGPPSMRRLAHGGLFDLVRAIILVRTCSSPLPFGSRLLIATQAQDGVKHALHRSLPQLRSCYTCDRSVGYHFT